MDDKFLKALRWIVAILDQQGVKYVISGGFAAYLYGSKRQINDLDVDIPENDIEKIRRDVKDYIVAGPEHVQDERWDLLSMTLNYHNQEIDISGALQQKVYDDVYQKWVNIPANFSKAKKMVVDGIQINVMDPQDLIFYKKFLIGAHQKADIKAIREFIRNSK